VLPFAHSYENSARMSLTHVKILAMHTASAKLSFPTSSLVLPRLRPSYTPPNFLPHIEKDQKAWEEKKRLANSASPPKRIAPCSVRRLNCGDDVEVLYQIWPWKKLGSDMAVQQRATSCAILESGELMATVKFWETRNPSDEYMPMDNYLIECDDISQMLSDHGAMCAQAAKLVEGAEGYLLPKQRMAEISELWITPAARARLVWAEPLRMLLKKLFQDAPDCYAVVLKAYPLEYAKGFRERTRELQEQLGEEAAEQVLQRENYLGMRRKTALMLLYMRELGFSPLDHAAGTMYWVPQR
jgi:hypothetical protein